MVNECLIAYQAGTLKTYGQRLKQKRTALCFHSTVTEFALEPYKAVVAAK
jgi:hypothetical protein